MCLLQAPQPSKACQKPYEICHLSHWGSLQDNTAKVPEVGIRSSSSSAGPKSMPFPIIPPAYISISGSAKKLYPSSRGIYEKPLRGCFKPEVVVDLNAPWSRRFAVLRVLEVKDCFCELVLTGPIHPEKGIEVSMGMSGLICCEVCCKCIL